jgi:hypothetical protein
MDNVPNRGVADSEPVSPPATTPPATAIAPPWAVLATNGGLTLAQSPSEYGVYNQNSFLGTWPLTPEGYRYAVQTYEAHQQSPAHGLAYTATGYQDPERLGLPTDPTLKSKTYSSPMSFVGSTRRIVAWASKLAKRSPGFAVVGWTLASLAMLSMWSFLLVWYFVVFWLFGIFVIPYRLIRRSQRKNLHVQQTSLATQQVMLQQMAAQQQQIQRQQQFMPPTVQVTPPSAPPVPLPPPPGVAPPPATE